MGRLSDAIAMINKEEALAITKEELDNTNRDPLDLVEEARQGLEIVGNKYDSGDYFLMELMYAADIFKDMSSLIAPKIQERHGGPAAKMGTVLLGTVRGDIHDLGKNIAGVLLECAGIEVIDLGVDVSAEDFIKNVKEHEPQVLGMSALLTASVDEMNGIVRALEEEGLKKGIKVIVGGGIVADIDESLVKADHVAINANEGVKVIKDWIKNSK